MDSLKKAKESLQIQSVLDRLPCRENEFDTIYEYIKERMEEGISGCMYIAGVPGTGKTATVNCVRSALENKVKSKLGMKFKFIEINGLKLTDPHQCYSHIYYELFGQRASASKAETKLNEFFSLPSSSHLYVILIVDELDSLHTPKQDILYHLFDWPCKPNSNLLVIAIANTLDLPERMMDKRVVSRAGFNRLDFQPYRHEDLQKIVAVRLKDNDIFKSDGVQLIARKVASISGDARKVLDICRRALEIAEREYTDTPSSRKKKTKPQVKMEHVQKALAETMSSPKIVFIKNASELEKYLLRAITEQFRLTGMEEGRAIDIYQHFVTICFAEGILDTSFSEFLEVAQSLHESSIITIELDKPEHLKRIRLIVSTDDIDFALKIK